MVRQPVRRLTVVEVVLLLLLLLWQRYLPFQCLKSSDAPRAKVIGVQARREAEPSWSRLHQMLLLYSLKMIQQSPKV